MAETPAQYVDIAVEMVTTRKEELNAIRRGLRPRFMASPVSLNYVAAVETAYRDLWRAWCAQPVRVADARKRLELVMT